MRLILLTAFVAALSFSTVSIASQDSELPGEQTFSLGDNVGRANRFELGASGTLVVEPDGRVSEVELDMAGPAAAHYRKAIEAWTFKPVEINGRLVRAKAHFLLDAFAEADPGSEKLRLGIGNVWFLDPPVRGGEATSASSDLRPPQFPPSAGEAGFGASVTVLLKLDAEGRVVDAGVSSLSLDTSEIRQRGRAESFAKQFAAAALNAARRWTITDASAIASGSAIVPVVFHSPRRVRGEWLPRIPLDVGLLPWMVVAQSEAVSMTAGGGAASGRFQLIDEVAGTTLN